jgi:transglutaminase-like putative cysteine protease
MIHTEAALGVRLERSAFEVVSFNYRAALGRRGAAHHRGVPGMRSLVKAGIDPGSSDAAATWRVTSAPIERFLLPRLAWLDGGRQATTVDRLRVGGPVPAAAGRSRSEYLGPAPLGSAGMAALARRAAGGAREPERMIAHLVRWVAREIAIDTAHAAPILSQRVAATRRAGAEGHARLFVELAGALELTARPVSGVAILDSGIFSHAWAEVWLDGRWLAVDPTFGHAPASTRLVRAAVGGSARAVDLVPLLGSASFTRIESDPIE